MPGATNCDHACFSSLKGLHVPAENMALRRSFVCRQQAERMYDQQYGGYQEGGDYS